MKTTIALLVFIALLLSVGLWLYVGQLRHQAELEQAAKDALAEAQQEQAEKDREAAAEAVAQKKIDDDLAAQKEALADSERRANEEQQRLADKIDEAEAQRKLEITVADHDLQEGLNAAASDADRAALNAEHDKKISAIEAKTYDELVADEAASAPQVAK